MIASKESTWKDFVKLMHLPLPFCVLAFATIGACLSERIYFDRLALTYTGILLALCFGAYSLDELHGRPYHTRFADRTLWGMTIFGLSGASVVALYLIMTVSILILIPAMLAAFFILAYNMELFGGRFHNPVWFGLSWGGLTTIASYYVQAVAVNVPVVAVSIMSSLVGVSIVYLTHKFRPTELSKRLGVPVSELRVYSRYSRKTAWVVVQIECYAMIALAVGMAFPKIT